MRARVVTALVGIPIVLAACFWTNPLGVGVLLLVVAVLAGSEATQLFACLKPKPLPLVWTIVATCVWILVPIASLNMLHWASVPSEVQQSTWNVRVPILIALLPLWAGDSAAIFAGRAFGKHPLAPTLSPKKTWEGAIANFLACLVVAWGTGTWIGIAPVYAILIGVSTGVLGQVGDLFESWLKRKAEIKDSGSLLPGHGGILDRIDSLLFTAIPTTLVYMYAFTR